MLKKERILENRKFLAKKSLYDIFEKKVLGAFHLEREIFKLKIGRKEQYQSRVQYIVFLVSCLEYFLEELFKKAVDNGIIKTEDFREIKNIASLKFNLSELSEIKENKIKLSEILGEEMNFQNMDHIIFLGDLLRVDENFKEISSKKNDLDLLDLNKLGSLILKRGSYRTDKKISTLLYKGLIKSSIKISKKDNNSLIKMINTIQKMILFRHKIVHKATLMKIVNWESLAYTMATVQLAYFFYQSYLLETNKKSKGGT